MQLQGELVLRGGGGSRQAYQPPYRNAPHAFYKICRDEGFRGIQAGLLPGLMYQVRVLSSATICMALRFGGPADGVLLGGLLFAVSSSRRCVSPTLPLVYYPVYSGIRFKLFSWLHSVSHVLL